MAPQQVDTPILGRLLVLATPLGNLNDLSDRQRDSLTNCDLIACEDTRTAQKLLAHLGIKKALTSLHDFNEQAGLEKLLQRLHAGATIVLTSDAGTPCLSDPGHRLVAACHDQKIPVSPIPGGSAVTTALSASGFPGDSFLFFGFLPRRGAERTALLKEMAASTRTTLFFESPQRIRDTLQELTEHLPPQRLLTLCRELTKLYEEIRRDTLQGLIAEPPQERGEFTVVVAPADEAERDERIKARYAFLKAHTPLQHDALLELIAAEFDMNPRRLHYLFDDSYKKRP